MIDTVVLRGSLGLKTVDIFGFCEILSHCIVLRVPNKTHQSIYIVCFSEMILAKDYYEKLDFDNLS